MYYAHLRADAFLQMIEALQKQILSVPHHTYERSELNLLISRV